MHRALSVLFSFDAPYATAFCVALATLASTVALPGHLPPAALGQEVTAPAAHVVVSAPSHAKDTAQSAVQDTLQDTLQDTVHDKAESDGHAEDGSADVIVLRAESPSGPDSPWVAGANDPAQSDREYLVETAAPGNTMVRQGAELAIGRLHPEFVHRLAAAVREARESGLASAGIFSAYRPPAFGVGGFSDKFNSLHTYGLAVDMSGIGGPGSPDARLWHEIAARHGVVCPYGFGNRAEWNHCQPTRIKIILPASPLRETVTAAGPVDLESMFQAGNSIIDSAADSNDAFALETAEHVRSGRHFNERSARTENRSAPWNPGLIKEEHSLRAERRRLARVEGQSGCTHAHRGRKDICGSSRLSETGNARSAHPRQASAASLGEPERL